jgi:hypothetical protein
MKNTLSVMFLMLMLVTIVHAQNSAKKIALTPNSQAATGDVVRALNSKRCRGIAILTGDSEMADYKVEFRRSADSFKLSGLTKSKLESPDEEWSGTLFSKSGDVMYATKSHSWTLETLEFAVLDVCQAIKKQK